MEQLGPRIRLSPRDPAVLVVFHCFLSEMTRSRCCLVVVSHPPLMNAVGDPLAPLCPPKFISGMAGSWPMQHSISGLVVEYIVAIDVTRVRFPADASFG